MRTRRKEDSNNVTKFPPPITFSSPNPTSEPFRMPRQTFPMFCQNKMLALFTHEMCRLLVIEGFFGKALKVTDIEDVDGLETHRYYQISFRRDLKLRFNSSTIGETKCQGLEVFLDFAHAFERSSTVPAER